MMMMERTVDRAAEIESREREEQCGVVKGKDGELAVDVSGSASECKGTRVGERVVEPEREKGKQGGGKGA
jgi:hypothetical protein